MKKYKIMGALFTAMMLVSSALSAGEGPSVKPNGCKGPVLCPSYPIYGRCDDCCDYRWHLNIGLLYQQPWMNDMGAGTADNGQNVNQGAASYVNTTSVFLEECFDYSLGLTAGIGYFMEHDNWFFLVDFDWLSANTSNAYNSIGSVYHLMGFTNTDVVNPVANTDRNLYTSLESKAALDIYDLNFALSRGSFHSKCFSYEPFAGVKALWYNGSQQRRGYNDGPASFGSNSSYIQTLFKYEAWGAGPAFGFNGEYFVSENFSFFSDSDIAVLYGGINSSNTSLYFDASVDNDTNGVATYVQNFKQPYFVPVRTIFGVKLSKYCLEDQHFISLKVGYDARYVLADSGLVGYVGSEAASPTSATNPIMPSNGYSIAANGLFLNFIWSF